MHRLSIPSQPANRSGIAPDQASDSFIMAGQLILGAHMTAERQPIVII